MCEGEGTLNFYSYFITFFFFFFSSEILRPLEFCTAHATPLIRPLQLNQNAVARLIFNVHRYTHTTPLLTDLHWLPVVAHIKFKTSVLAYQAVKGSAPTYIQQLIRPDTPARPLRSATSGLLAPPHLHISFTTAVCSGPTMVEWPSYRRQNSRDVDHVQTQNENSLLQTASLPPSLITSY